MPKPFLSISIDDYLERTCAPDEDFWPALYQLHNDLLHGKFEISGWRCSWDDDGQNRQTDHLRQSIPATAVADLEFNILPDDSDFVLTLRGTAWSEQDNNNNGIRWIDEQYDERIGPVIRPAAHIHGWCELRLSGNMIVQTLPEVHSGMAGRPSAKCLYEAELERRIAANELHASLNEEAKALFDWFKTAHPSLNPGSWKTIRNNIRQRYWQAGLVPP